MTNDPPIGPTDPVSSTEKRLPIPKKLSPTVRKAIKLVVSGLRPSEAAREVGIRPDYLRRILAAPVGRDEFTRLNSLVEGATVDRLAAEASGQTTQPFNEAAAEVDMAIVESIRELRRIMLTSRSDMAKAKAATEILKLGNAERRLAASAAPVDSSVPLAADDQKLLLSAITDLRTMHAGAFVVYDGTSTIEYDSAGNVVDGSAAPVADIADSADSDSGESRPAPDNGDDPTLPPSTEGPDSED